MPVYSVIRKSDGLEITRYCAGAVMLEYGDLAEFDHIEYVEGVTPTIQTGRTMTKLEYLRRFTQSERVAIREAAKANPILEDYMALLELATEVDTSDADTIAAVNMLEQAGLIAPGRAMEILNGE